MGSERVYLAADIGAGSGRVIAGIYERGKIRTEEVSRFENQAIRLGNGWHWQATHMFTSIKEGIALAVSRFGDSVCSIGVDTWGVDYGLLDHEQQLLGVPFCYRDERTKLVLERADEVLSSEKRYSLTGIQKLEFNTLYQLLSERRAASGLLQHCSRLLFMPDLMNYWLCGVARNEVTIASTSELLDARSGRWSEEIFSAYELPRELFQDPVEPGEALGALLESVARESGGAKINVVTVPSHDTAAAVAACPFGDGESLFLSSGTWSLLGMESEVPYLSDAAREQGFTNERGVEGTTRLLKNISGFWVFQQCKCDWDARKLGLSYARLAEMAERAEPFQRFINPDDARFAVPGRMLDRVQSYLEETGQEVASDPGILSRSLFEGLVFRYRKAIRDLSEVTGRRFGSIHVIGGGSQNALINQLTADATGCRVVAGPVEASSLGNILAQMKADGQISSVREGRSVVADSFAPRCYEPKSTGGWDELEPQFDAVVGR